MSYNGSRIVFYPYDPQDYYSSRGDIVRITGTGEIQVYLDRDPPAQPVATFRLKVAGKDFDVVRSLPTWIYDFVAEDYDTAQIPFWFQFLITYTMVTHANGDYNMRSRVNGIVAMANDIVAAGDDTRYNINWSIRPRTSGIDALDSRQTYDADVLAWVDPDTLFPGEIFQIQFDQATIEYLWTPWESDSSS